MFPYVLALVIGFGSFAFYMAAFFFPEVHRKNDFLWSGVGLFYALVLWVCAGRITGAVLLSQMASVSLLGWLGWQTLLLRRQLTVPEQQTPVPSSAEFSDKLGTLLSPQGVSQLFGGVTAFFQNISRPAKPLSSTGKTPVTAQVNTSEVVINQTEPASEQIVAQEAIADHQLTPPITDTTDNQPVVIHQSANLEPFPEQVPEVLIETNRIEAIEEDEFDATIEPQTQLEAPVKSEPVKTKTIAPSQKPPALIAQVTGFFQNLLAKSKPKTQISATPTIVQETPTIPEEAIAPPTLVEPTPPAQTVTTAKETSTIVEQSNPPDIAAFEITPPTPTPETTEADSTIAEPTPPVAETQTPQPTDTAENLPAAPTVADQQIDQSPQLIRPHPPDPKLVEAAKKTPPSDQPEISPPADLAPPAEP